MNKILHCGGSSSSSGGGIKSYLDGLLALLPDICDRKLITSAADIDQSQCALLHIHEGWILASLSEQSPVTYPIIYTLHNHNLYCPSGTKYFPMQSRVCDRNVSIAGCTWGHLIDGCGSRRPHKIIANFSRVFTEFEAVKRLGIIAIANSNYVRSQLISHGLPESQVVMLRYGIAAPTSKHSPLDRAVHSQKRILFAGRIVQDKGLDWLLRAMPLLDPDIHLDIAGDGWSMPQVRQLADDLQLGDRLTWHGWCQGEQLEDLYRQSFAVIFPSVWPEPAGLVTLEAYARFRAVIASAVGGIPEHIEDGKTGILVPPNDVQQLATAINDLAANFDKALAIGLAGHQLFCREFTIAIHAQRLRKIYDSAIAEFAQRKSQ